MNENWLLKILYNNFFSFCFHVVFLLLIIGQIWGSFVVWNANTNFSQKNLYLEKQIAATKKIQAQNNTTSTDTTFAEIEYKQQGYRNKNEISIPINILEKSRVENNQYSMIDNLYDKKTSNYGSWLVCLGLSQNTSFWYFINQDKNFIHQTCNQ